MITDAKMGTSVDKIVFSGYLQLFSLIKVKTNNLPHENLSENCKLSDYKLDQKNRVKSSWEIVLEINRFSNIDSSGDVDIFSIRKGSPNISSTRMREKLLT